MTHIDEWRFQSNYPMQLALGLASIGVGLPLMISFRHFHVSGMTNSLAGFLLGLFLFLIGAIVLLTQGKQTIVVDSRKRQIVVKDKTPFRVKTRRIRFDDIAGTGIGYLGKRSNFVNFYSINLHLRSGTVYSLFSPGRFYEGAFDRSVMETRRQQLETLLTQNART